MNESLSESMFKEISRMVSQKLSWCRIWFWWCVYQNYKCLASTTISGDGIYVEYTYNGDKQELYEDVYKKVTNTCITEE